MTGAALNGLVYDWMVGMWPRRAGLWSQLWIHFRPGSNGPRTNGVRLCRIAGSISCEDSTCSTVARLVAVVWTRREGVIRIVTMRGDRRGQEGRYRSLY